MLGFRRATCPRVSGQGPMMARARQRGYSVGATEPTGRPCRQRTLRCSQGSQGWKLKLVRQGPERWQWSGRELSRPKSLDIRRPIQGRLDKGGDVQPLVAVVAEGDGPVTLGGPHASDDRLQPDTVLDASRSSGVAEAG